MTLRKSAILERLNRATSGQHGPDFAEVSRLFVDIARDCELVLEVLREKLAKIADGQEEALLVAEQIEIASSPSHALTLVNIKPGDSDIASVPYKLWMACVSDGRLAFTRYSDDATRKLDVFNEAAKLTPGESAVLGRGKVLELPEDALVHFNAIEPVWVLRLAVFAQPDEQPTLTWIFDPESLRAVGVVASRERDTALVHAAEALAEFGAEESLPCLAALSSSSKAHFVRWAALQAMALIDAEAAYPHVRSACDDAHPEVRIAAAEAMLQLDSALA